ncbi:hypothetical protein RFI_27042 [Reticulomyxa filosa]|uniref:Uncharacterized protein n=1 Tax=Reticulomyxa filosa TaxID=46433 RepID=X6MBD0_RETFI|nr:hypothetical protein RFI_27042 [Reticulomyxa filosa]|eukprot:ETO10335.1 hypothetical protein RFI_27042 [Reticulomyxa filosa]
MYSINWDKEIPQVLSKMVGHEITSAYGSYFDSTFTIELKNGNKFIFGYDGLLHRSEIRLEVLLNQSVLYNPTHFDAGDLVIQLGTIIHAKPRLSPQTNAREIRIYFGAEKKHFQLSEMIHQTTKRIYDDMGWEIASLIAEFMQLKHDTMILRCYRPAMDNELSDQNKTFFSMGDLNTLAENHTSHTNGTLKNSDANTSHSTSDLYSNALAHNSTLKHQKIIYCDIVVRFRTSGALTSTQTKKRLHD